MKTHLFQVNKLIRDKIPSILESNNISVRYRLLSGEECIKALKAKILEEAEEVAEASDQKHLKEELGDLLEVIYGLTLASGFSLQDVEEVRIAKRDLKGGFDGRTYGEVFAVPEDHPDLEFYQTRLPLLP